MAAPSKKRAIGNELNEIDSEDLNEASNDELQEEMEDDDEEELSESIDKTIQVDFEAQNPQDSDFHGIRKLLGQLFLKSHVDISEMSDTIISQNYIGSVIKQSEQAMEEESSDSEDMEDVLGLITVLNITERKDVACIKQTKELLLQQCKQCAQKQSVQLESLLSDSSKQIGLLLSERFINIPPQIALPSYESLWKELEKAVQKKMKYKFDFYLIISKTYKLPESEEKGHSKLEERTWVNAEEEFLYKHSVLTFDYSVISEKDSAMGEDWEDEEMALIPHRTVMIIPADHIDAVMQDFREALSVQ